MGPRPRRRHTAPRCLCCGQHTARCFCAELPRFELPFRLIVVQHAVERDRPTNTARLALRLLEPTELHHYALRDQPWRPVCVRADMDFLLLYPDPAARALEPDMLRPRPGRGCALVVPDGSWRQAAHMSRRLPDLRALPRVRLPPGPPGRWVIRRARAPEQVCTLEAIARVVRLAGCAAAADALEAALDRAMAGMLAMKAGNQKWAVMSA